MRKVKKLNNNRGLTLVEVVLSLAIMAILLVTILTFFTSGVRLIFLGGERTKNVYEAQNLVDLALKKEDTGDPRVRVEDDESLSLVFKDSENKVIDTGEIKGSIITVNSLGEREVLIKTFLPGD